MQKRPRSLKKVYLAHTYTQQNATSFAGNVHSVKELNVGLAHS